MFYDTSWHRFLSRVLKVKGYQLYLDVMAVLLAPASLNLIHPGLVLQGPGCSSPFSKTQW